MFCLVLHICRSLRANSQRYVSLKAIEMVSFPPISFSCAVSLIDREDTANKPPSEIAEAPEEVESDADLMAATLMTSSMVSTTTLTIPDNHRNHLHHEPLLFHSRCGIHAAVVSSQVQYLALTFHPKLIISIDQRRPDCSPAKRSIGLQSRRGVDESATEARRAV